MNNHKTILKNITKTFGRRLIFKNISVELNSGTVFGLSGRNGSGKSTLAKIIAGVVSPTKGNVIHFSNGVKVESERLHSHLGFVSPYLVLYDEFTAEENIAHFAKIRGCSFDRERSDHLFNKFSLYDRRNDLLKGYSSGMKQRMKYIFALYHSPGLLIFDEPTSNLDLAGKDAVYRVIDESAENSLVIIASNEESDLNYCGEILQIEEFKN